MALTWLLEAPVTDMVNCLNPRAETSDLQLVLFYASVASVDHLNCSRCILGNELLLWRS